MATRKKYPSGALQMVLFIGALITILLLGFVLIFQLEILMAEKSKRAVESVQAVDEVLNGSSLLPDQIQEASYPNGIRIHVASKYWGLFGISHATASFAQGHFSKIALTGTPLQNPSQALYLTDTGSPLVFVGNSAVIGDALLPKTGIEIGNIEGHTYYGRGPILGSTGLSSSQLPPLPVSLKNHLERLNTIRSNSNSFPGEAAILSGDTLIRSYSEPTLLLDFKMLPKGKKYIAGNIIIHDGELITLDSLTHLQDVLLLAPKIEIDDKVSGSFQAIARNELKVGKDCQLKYPSALWIQSKDTLPLNHTSYPALQIGTNSTVSGIVGFISDNTSFHGEADIQVGEGTKVTGQIYCQGSLELRGTVEGYVMAHSFVVNYGGYRYLNHIFGGGIDRFRLQPEYIGLSLMEQTPRKIAKWLY